MQLSKRLQAVANLVPKAVCMADVGTDHGYIPIYLVEQGICKRAIAMDVRKGPLARAGEHIEKAQLGAYIQTRLSDGLRELEPLEAQAIVIAGMGGATMMGILEKGKALLDSETLLVLQPQSELEEFRRYLVSEGFCFLAEDMVLEDGKYYPMMQVKKSETAGGRDFDGKGLSQLELRYGPLLLAQKHPVLKEFLNWQLEQKQKILNRLLEKSEGEGRQTGSSRLETEIAGINQALQRYEEV